MNRYFLISILLILLLSGCKGIDEKNKDYKTGETNFFITIFDSDITDPENDRRCYYVIYIDKIESGRTTTGLESQHKFFETTLAQNRHLVKVEKWILNENMGRYIKMNNIDQPKPDYIYVNIEPGKSVKVKLTSSKTGIASYSMSNK